MIIVSITGPTMTDARRQLAESAPFADLFELRLDLIEGHILAELMRAAQRPVIVTCRPVREGGKYAGSERDRLELLEAGALLGAAFVDLELSTAAPVVRRFLARQHRTAVILSAHRARTVRKGIAQLYRRMHATGAHVMKLAFPVEDGADLKGVVEFLSLAKSDGRRAVGIGLGSAGEASRVLYRRLGGWATYAAPENGPPAGEGQICASLLRTLYRAHRLDARTQVFGVVGFPVAQSRGGFVHNPLFHRARRNAVYTRFPVADLPAFMADIAPLLQGFSVTIPHKRAVMRYLDSVDPGAEAIGAVNTVLRKSGGWFGSNTDAAGALDAIEEVTPVRGKTMLLLGTGGAARAIGYEARARGAMVVIAGRNRARTQALASHCAVESVSWKQRSLVDYDILANATSVGMAPHDGDTPYPFPINPRALVFDVVYNPPETHLLRDAKKRGAVTVPGTAMYLHQAIRQSALYTGRKPSLALMKKLLAAAYRT